MDKSGKAEDLRTFYNDEGICDRICEKVPFPHILHTSKQNDVTLDSLY